MHLTPMSHGLPAAGARLPCHAKCLTRRGNRAKVIKTYCLVSVIHANMTAVLD